MKGIQLVVVVALTPLLLASSTLAQRLLSGLWKNKFQGVKSSLLASLLLLIMVASAHSQDTTYTFVSTSPGNPNDFSGSLTLDAPSSASGGLSDVVSLTLSDKLGIVWSGPLSGDWASFGDFSWNSSTIISMDIYDHSYDFETPGQNIAIGNAAVSAEFEPADGPSDPGVPFGDNLGYWSIPDASSTIVMLSVTTFALLVSRPRLSSCVTSRIELGMRRLTRESGRLGPVKRPINEK